MRDKVNSTIGLKSLHILPVLGFATSCPSWVLLLPAYPLQRQPDQILAGLTFGGNAAHHRIGILRPETQGNQGADGIGDRAGFPEN